VGSVRNVFWRLLAGVLGWAAALLRRRPSGGGPDAWRAVHFSFSHFGEDLVVFRLLSDCPAAERGCFVDVGAFDPVLHSNTFLLYQHGWRGLNVDASPARIARFARQRPGDTNLVAVVADEPRDVNFVEYPTPGTSRFAEVGETPRANQLGESPTHVSPCRTTSLTDLLKAYNPPAVDFLNIDCEGAELAVLRGLDWGRWPPKVIAVEANTPADRDTLSAFLTPLGYTLAAVHVVTLLFIHPSVRNRLPHGLRGES
jgi:FkbM family methyltransferase